MLKVINVIKKIDVDMFVYDGCIIIYCERGMEELINISLKGVMFNILKFFGVKSLWELILV